MRAPHLEIMQRNPARLQRTPVYPDLPWHLTKQLLLVTKTQEMNSLLYVRLNSSRVFLLHTNTYMYSVYG